MNNEATLPTEAFTNFYDEPYTALKLADKHFVELKAKKEKKPTAQTKDARFLVIDDRKQGSNLICFLLKKHGHVFDLVDSGELALARLRSRQYDLIFLDLDQFCSNNYQLLRSILMVEKALLRQTPIIGMQTPMLRTNQRNGVEESLILKAVINKTSPRAVLDIIGTYSKENNDSDANEEFLSEDKARMSMARLEIGTQEFEAALSLLPAALKTLTSCLKLAIEEQNRENIAFLGAAMQHSCLRVGLASIDRLVAHLISEANLNHWTQVATLMEILNTKCNLAITYLQANCESLALV